MTSAIEPPRGSAVSGSRIHGNLIGSRLGVGIAGRVIAGSAAKLGAGSAWVWPSGRARSVG